ncbi:MAG: FkbM family methyltransferase, partial [Nitrososphaera sp.]|nr:FkbM family methyltransferase [Nitrososphaera sp.]
PTTFAKLKEMAETWGFTSFNFGCGSENTKRKLFDYADADGSKHASIYLDVIRDIHKAAVVEHCVNIMKLDDFAKQHGLKQIDLLKIDAEGSELDVLKGFSEFIRGKRVKAVQFEFNEMNIASRVFFKDFWSFLSEYDFFRMVPDGLVPITVYSPLLCEIFAYQNIVALLKH